MVTRLTYKGILTTIGNTPTVELQNMSPKEGVRIFAKLEGQNQTGSVKDRIALKMIELAEQEESTSASANHVIRLRHEPEAVTGTADSIYRYDRDALLAALKQARMGKTA